MNEITLRRRWWAASLAIAASICLLGMTSSAKAAVYEDHFCWGRTITPASPCNAFESELEGIHKWVYAVHVRGVEHSVCVTNVYTGQKACSGGPNQDAWITMTPTSDYVWPKITINNGVQGATTVYGWVHYQDPPGGGGGGGGEEPPPPAEEQYRYMLGTSSGSGFASWTKLLGGMSKPQTMRVGDYTGDGKADIVSSEPDGIGSYRYMLGVSNGSGVSSWSGILGGMSKPIISALSDYTGDGKADIVSTEYESSNGPTRYMLGRSLGSGSPAWSFLLQGMTEPHPMRLGDFTGDGKADIIAIEPTGTTNRYMLGTSNGTGVASWTQILSGMSGVAGMHVADFTGDGKADIVAAEPEGNGKLRYMLGTSNGTGVASWKNMMGGMSPLAGMALADLTGDGKADVIAAEPEGNGKTRYMLGKSNGTGFASWTNMMGGMSPLTLLSAGDYNGDGKADVVAVEKECGC